MSGIHWPQLFGKNPQLSQSEAGGHVVRVWSPRTILLVSVSYSNRDGNTIAEDEADARVNDSSARSDLIGLNQGSSLLTASGGYSKSLTK